MKTVQDFARENKIDLKLAVAIDVLALHTGREIEDTYENLTANEAKQVIRHSRSMDCGWALKRLTYR